MSQDPIISFIYPVTDGVIGGVQVLLINVISYICDNEICRVRLYDYQKGLIKTKLDTLQVKNFDFIPLDGYKFKIPNVGDEVFVVPGMLFMTLPFLFRTNRNVKLLVWDVYYPHWYRFNKIGSIPLPGLRRRIMQALWFNDGIIFMDTNCLNIFKREGYRDENNSRIVPIPVYIPEAQKNKEFSVSPSKGRRIRFGYVGTSNEWKIAPVIKLIADLGLIGNPYELHIITTDSKSFRERLHPKDNIELYFYENLFREELEQVLSRNVDIGCAMGTSSLEISKLGIPTILLDFSKGKFPDHYRYKWLHENNMPGNLGRDINEESFNNDGRQLSDLLREFDSDAKSLGESCLAYVRDNHEVEIVINKLMHACHKTRLTFSRYNNVMLCMRFLYKLVRNKRFLPLH